MPVDHNICHTERFSFSIGYSECTSGSPLPVTSIRSTKSQKALTSRASKRPSWTMSSALNTVSSSNCKEASSPSKGAYFHAGKIVLVNKHGTRLTKTTSGVNNLPILQQQSLDGHTLCSAANGRRCMRTRNETALHHAKETVDQTHPKGSIHIRKCIPACSSVCESNGQPSCFAILIDHCIWIVPHHSCFLSSELGGSEGT